VWFTWFGTKKDQTGEGKKIRERWRARMNPQIPSCPSKKILRIAKGEGHRKDVERYKIKRTGLRLLIGRGGRGAARKGGLSYGKGRGGGF